MADENSGEAQGGHFIVFEGADGSGLSTQAPLLRGWYDRQDHQVYLTKEPSMGPAGALTRLALLGRLGYPPEDIHGQAVAADQQTKPIGDEVMALLYAADRLDHLRAEIEPRLQRGVTVICDRYYLSSLAYQSLTADLAWVRALNSKARRPDLTIYLDVPMAAIKRRMARRGGIVELYDHEEKLLRIRENYLRLIDEAKAEGEQIAIVDGSLAVQEVHAAVVAAVREYLG